MRPLHCERVFAAEKADSNNNMEQVPPKAGKRVQNARRKRKPKHSNDALEQLKRTLSGAGKALSEISASPASMNQCDLSSLHAHDHVFFHANSPINAHDLMFICLRVQMYAFGLSLT